MASQFIIFIKYMQKLTDLKKQLYQVWLKIWLPLELRGVMRLSINLVLSRHQDNIHKGETLWEKPGVKSLNGPKSMNWTNKHLYMVD